MRNLNVLAALLAVALVVPASFAQSTDSVSKDLSELKARVAALEVENASLKGANDGVALEGQVNALAERFTVGNAAPKVTFSGEFRARYENMDAGANRTWDIGNYYRLGFGYDVGGGVSMKMSLHNINTMGTNFDSPLRVHEAWMNTDSAFGLNGLGMKLGRQELAFGNQFVYGVDDWNPNPGVASDLINFSYGTESFSANLVYDLNSSADVNGDHNQNYILYVAIKSLKDMTVEVYYSSNDNNASADAGDRYGAHLGACFGGIAFDANLDVQEDTSAASDDTFAYEVNADYDLNKDLGLFARVYSAETGYAFTGNRHSNTGYRARYGLADYFDLSAGTSDVFSAQVGASMGCGSGWTAGATIAMFDQDVDSARTGNEVDVWAEHACSDNATLGAGVAFVSPDVGDNSTMFYVQARIAF